MQASKIKNAFFSVIEFLKIIAPILDLKYNNLNACVSRNVCLGNKQITGEVKDELKKIQNLIPLVFNQANLPFLLISRNPIVQSAHNAIKSKIITIAI